MYGLTVAAAVPLPVLPVAPEIVAVPSAVDPLSDAVPLADVPATTRLV